MHAGSIARESAARWAALKVVVQRRGISAEVLAVEAGGDRVSGCVAFHALVVDLQTVAVPDSVPAMDRLTALLVQARDGDRLALGAAIRLSQGEVWRLAAHLIGPDQADDVTQDVFIRAWRALPNFRVESSGRTWLLSITRRACADNIRGQTRWRKLTARLQSDRARAVGTPAVDESHGLRELIARLPLAQREAFVLTQITGCSYAEAAELCGVQVGTIRSRVARARAELIELVRQARAV